jgi:diguanylate cyclase (GGDEF)-like protein
MTRALLTRLRPVEADPDWRIGAPAMTAVVVVWNTGHEECSAVFQQSKPDCRSRTLVPLNPTQAGCGLSEVVSAPASNRKTFVVGTTQFPSRHRMGASMGHRMRRAIRLFQSWCKEERRTPLEPAVLLRISGVCLLVLTPLMLLHLQRRSELMLRQQQAGRDDTVALMEAALSGTSRVARDWGHWDDAYRFARGTNPGYPQRNLDTGALFDAGAIMVMLRPDGSPLHVHAAAPFRLASYRALIRCAQDNRGRLPSLTSTLRVACVADNGALYLGTATPISDNNATAPSAGTLVMFDPLLRREYRPGIRQRLEILRRQLLFMPARQPATSASEAVLPPIHGPDDTLLAMQRPALLPVLGRSLLEDLPLLLAIPLLAIGLRSYALLRRRRQRIVQRQAERRANQRIREACRSLDHLLEGLLPADRLEVESRQLLGPINLGEHVAPVALDASPAEQGASVHERELARVTTRVQRFLQSASNLALLDHLTQLPNRRYFIARVTEVAARHSQAGQHFALLFVDIDKFKVINDTYGHAVGDAVLINVSQRLRGVLCSGDFMARYGGDELAVILDLSSLEDQSLASLNRAARERAHAMVDSLIPPVLVADLPIAVSLSIGVTLVDPQEADLAAVIQRSDLAMYQAKRSRDSCIVGPENIVQAPQLNRYQLFTDLIQAIRNRELQVFYQPIAAADGTWRGVEALARWQHPERGWIEPMLFLEMAEQHRQMQLLGNELIRISLDGFQQLRERFGDLSFYLNLTPIQLLDADLAERLLSQLQIRCLPCSLLTLELTEHSILEPNACVRANLDVLRQAGVRLALDDFGTGYSSLIQLKTIRPDVVKIDKSFTQAVGDNPLVHEIITLLAALAPRLELELIAEGIEDRDRLADLVAMGVQLFQGFEFGRPRPVQDWLQADASAGRANRRAIV